MLTKRPFAPLRSRCGTHTLRHLVTWKSASPWSRVLSARRGKNRRPDRPDDLTFSHVIHYRTPEGQARIGFFFTATRWQGQPVNREPDKCARLVWAHPARAGQHGSLHRGRAGRDQRGAPLGSAAGDARPYRSSSRLSGMMSSLVRRALVQLTRSVVVRPGGMSMTCWLTAAHVCRTTRSAAGWRSRTLARYGSLFRSTIPFSVPGLDGRVGLSQHRTQDPSKTGQVRRWKDDRCG